MHVVAVPVKALAKAKRRLAPVTSPLERGAIVLAMLEDVLDATLVVHPWETWVISPDEVILEVAARRGARPLPEEKGPLAAAIRQVERLALEREVDALAILPGDLPLLTPEALAGALRTVGPVVVAPASAGPGTNLLLRRPPRAVAARFGPDSFARHLEAAAARGLPVSVVRDDALGLDLDGPGDILSVLGSGDGGRTRRVLAEMGIASRIERPMQT